MDYDAELDRTLFWAPIDGPGLEHLRLRASDGGYIAAGVVMAVEAGTPFRLLYKIKTDDAWRTRKVVLEAYTPQGESFKTLRSDGQGHWKGERDVELRDYDGCLDVDISVTPFTNTLVINRLPLQAGQQADIPMIYVKAPELTVTRVQQRYRCATRDAQGGRVTFDNLAGFTADLPIDRDGLVLDYPKGWRRVYPV